MASNASQAAAQGRGPGAGRRLTSLQQRAGWRSLFDGETTRGWRAYDGDSFPKRGWVVEDGCLRHVAGEAGGDIVSEESFEDFELEFDWLVMSGAAGGVKYRVPAHSGPRYMVGPEYEIQAGSHGANEVDPLHATGALFDIVPRSKAAAPTTTGTFHHTRIVVRGARIEHWLDGTRLLEAQIGSPAWKRAVAASKFYGLLGFAEGAGHIGLEDQGGDVRFRNIHIRDLRNLPGEELVLSEGEVDGGAQSFLVTERSFGDFRFELEVKPERPGNSGIQVRSHVDGAGELVGYQIAIDSSERAWSGGLYDRARRGWLQKDDGAGRRAFRYGEWNHYVIECVGPWIRAWIDGVPTTDHLDTMDLEGLIGLQVHSGDDTRVRWRNLRLFDWGTSTWQAARTEASDDGGTLLVGDDDAWSDFAFRLRLAPGARLRVGLCLARPECSPGSSLKRHAPGLFSFEGGWMLDSAELESDELFPPVEPCDVSVARYGTRVALHVDGKLVLDFAGMDGAQAGFVGWWTNGVRENAVTDVQVLVEPSR